MIQSCLEYTSMDARHEQMARSEFNRDYQYDASYIANNAKSGKVKGTGHGGHSHWLPNCRGAIGIINYSNFDTAQTSMAGHDCDVAARATSMSRSLYNAENPYGMIDTTRNVNEGQFVNIYRPKTQRMCYIP